MSLLFQPVQVATGSSDSESRLVFDDGFLVAILVQLCAQHGDHDRREDQRSAVAGK